ncbi:MAG TPA: NapC/NirT family cytochrome c [Polyangiaceae bacterium]|jgi:cytochrome c-type protein NapC
MILPTSPLSLVALCCAGLSAVILVVYVVRRPPLVRATKVWLFLGLGALPIAAAGAGNVQGFEATKSREFCGSCHVMALHAADSDDLSSHSLAARHARNPMFGDENCYACHADYGMFGTVVTKAGGMRHVWLYYTQYRTTAIEQAKQTITLRAPYPNDNCMQCHSTLDDLWQKVPDHQAMLAEVRAGRVSCASAGCHGLAHPFFRPAEGTP